MCDRTNTASCSNGSAGHAHMYDLSIPQHRMYELVERIRERLQHIDDVVVIGFGHFGDGNLHLLIADARELRDEV
jgi:FAD/FMN-containing dehydrogenase